MKYAVDEIIDSIAILENIETNEKKEVDLNKLPGKIKEGNVLIEEVIYKLDEDEELKRRTLIQNKLERLKEKKSWKK